MDRFSLTQKVKKKLAHLSRWTTSLRWTSKIKMDPSIWPFQPILNPSTSLLGIFHVQHEGKHLLFSFYGLLTADLLVLLVHMHLQQV